MRETVFGQGDYIQKNDQIIRLNRKKFKNNESYSKEKEEY